MLFLLLLLLLPLLRAVCNVSCLLRCPPSPTTPTQLGPVGTAGGTRPGSANGAPTGQRLSKVAVALLSLPSPLSFDTTMGTAVKGTLSLSSSLKGGGGEENVQSRRHEEDRDVSAARRKH